MIKDKRNLVIFGTGTPVPERDNCYYIIGVENDFGDYYDSDNRICRDIIGIELVHYVGICLKYNAKRYNHRLHFPSKGDIINAIIELHELRDANLIMQELSKEA